MKPIFRLLMLFILAVPSSITAQEISKVCNLNYKLAVVADKKTASNEFIALMNWDFTEAMKSAKSITVEIVPINDCYLKEQATDFKKSILYTINKQNVKSVTKLALLDLNSKCFKYRVSVVASNCEKTTEWNYYNFVL